MRNFYHILGLSFEAQPENQVISAAYKALVKLYHPDVFKGEKKEQKRKISEINEAYEILNNHESKLKYDKKLENFLKKNYSKFSNEEFDDNSEFDEKFIDDDWEIALIVYPELIDYKNNLSNYSKQLALQFQFYLLETKEFHKLEKVSEFFIDSFLERKFGRSKKIKVLSKFLIEEGEKEPALFLNKLIRVIGASSESRIISTFFEDHEEIKEKFEKEIESNTIIDTKSLLQKKYFNDSTEIFPFIIIIIFFIFMFIMMTSESLLN